MYSRYNSLQGKPMQLPENYSGCAFPPQKAFAAEPKPIPREHFTPPTDVRRVEIAKPTLSDVPVKQPEPIESNPQNEFSPPTKEACKNEQTSTPSVPAQGFLGNLGKHLPLSQGLGFEELLLLGLILLLSQTDQSSDVVLWLALLLFCD